MQCLIARYLLMKKKGSAIVHELTSRKILSETIRRNKGREIITKVGHPYIIDAMLESKAIYGCEMSGHSFFGEMYCLDDGVLAAIHVMNILNASDKRLSSLLKPLDKYEYLGELTYKVRDEDKKAIVERVREFFKKNKAKKGVKKIFSIDGTSIVAKDYWINIRPSNTEPILRLRIEGKNRKKLEKVRKEIEKIINY